MITLADLDAPDFIAMISAHETLMLELSPPDSCHYLQIDGLRTQAVTVWELRREGVLAAIGALKEIDPAHGEIKSMHTATSARGNGLGARMLTHITAAATARGYKRLSLETGSTDGFAPARTLYEQRGFHICGPFGDYSEDPHSVFMTLAL